jgi:alkyl hydroperoxide reductase subunit AhpC
MQMSVRIGQEAPLIDVQFDAVLGDGTIGKVGLRDITKQKKYTVLAFYPLAFTFVCPSEICEFSDKAPKFNESNCEVVLAAVDSVYATHAWKQVPRKAGGIGEISVPVIADVTRELGVAYDCLLPSGHHSRCTVIIDSQGIVRHVSQNDPPVGRNIDEFLRLVEAYQFVDEHGEVCPAGWNKNNKATIKTDPTAKLEYFEKANK